MKQVVQSYKTGEVKVRDVPVSGCGTGRVLVRNRYSLVSVGTERSLIELGKKSLAGKALARPDLVRRAWDKAKKEGLLKTYREALGRLDVPTPLGYSSAGVVVESGTAATEFAPGDRVACVGQGFASHAEFVSVPVNLVCPLPDGVSEEAAAFGMLGIIALHGVRCANLSFGGYVAVLGLGLLGLLTAQMLRAYGCRVAGIDLDAKKVELAKNLGIDAVTTDESELSRLVYSATSGLGADAVIIAAATKSSAPVDLAVNLARPRGKIVVVGVADIHPDRNEMWRKELELVVSKAAGPGSLDPLYELEGVDLPVGEVRWTQNRNLREFMRLIETGKVLIEPMITHRFSIEKAEDAYSGIASGRLSEAVGIVLNYPGDNSPRRKVEIGAFSGKTGTISNRKVALAAVGAGLFGKALLLPTLAKTSNVRLHTLVTASGASGEYTARKFGFRHSSTDSEEVWTSKEIRGVVAITPHSSHAAMTLRALENDKPLFLEKPLCVTPEELDRIEESMASRTDPALVMVGHNRRFSPHTVRIRSWLKGRKEPLTLQMRINSGFVDADHWVHSEAEGRSRIVGEMSHFVDLMQAVVGANPVKVYAEKVSGDDRNTINNDNVVVTLKFEDGSVASLTYSASGDKAYSREAMEIFFEGKTVRSEDFRVSEFFADGRKRRYKTSSQELGYTQELRHFVDAIRGKAAPATTPVETTTTMRTVFAVEKSLATGMPVTISSPRDR